MWAGRTTHTHRTTYIEHTSTDETTGFKDRGVRWSLTPQSCQVNIHGPYTILLVVTDLTASSQAPNITLNGVQRKMWQGSRDIGTSDVIDFWAIWNAYYTNSNINRIRGDMIGAWSLMYSKLGSGGACNIALSVAADMSRGNSPSVYMDSTGPDADKYDNIAMGSWTIGGGRTDPKSSFMVSSDILTGDTVADHSAVTKRICVYWTSMDLETENVRYNLPTASSLLRLAMAASLIDTEQGSHMFRSLSGMQSWLHMHALTLYNTSAAMFTSEGISPRIWLGWEDRKHTTVAIKLDTLTNICFGGLIRHLDLTSLGLGASGNWVWENATDYWESYAPQGNNSVGFFLSIPSWLYRMWCLKIRYFVLGIRLVSSPWSF